MANREDLEFTKNIQDLSVHGWPRVFSTSARSRRLFWLILCCVSSGFFISFAKQIVSVYGKRETYMTTKVTPVPFLNLPAMTFCNRNIMLDENNVTENVIIPENQNLPSTCANYTGKQFANSVNKLFFENACKMLMAMSRNATIMYELYKFDLRFPNNFSFVPHYWPCFEMNKDGNLGLGKEGEGPGFRMILFFNETDISNRPIAVLNSHMKEWRAGIYVDLHDPVEYIRSITGISLPPGFHTLINLKKVTSSRMKGPFSSKCYEDSDNIYVKILPGKHTVFKCKLACELNFYYNKCGTIGGFGGPFVDRTLYPNKSNKSEKDMLMCIFDAGRNFDSGICDCRLPCQEVKYETQVTYRKWPQSWEVKELAPILSDVTGISQSEIDIDLLRKHLILVSIYYSDLLETKLIEEEAYGIEKVISDFGGQMGMFLGASFLSLIEIILVIYDYVKRACGKQRSIRADGSVSNEDNSLPVK